MNGNFTYGTQLLLVGPIQGKMSEPPRYTDSLRSN